VAGDAVREPAIEMFVAHPSERPSRDLAALAVEELAGADVVITTYGQVPRLPWVVEVEWTLLVLDEAQAIKNPSAKQAQAVKRLRSRARVALTGTPIENRLADLGLAARSRLPAMYTTREHVEAGGLMAYGPSGAIKG